MTRTSRQAGLTLIEILVVVAILTILFSIGVLMSMEAFRGYSRRSERDTIVGVMERARSRSMANVHQQQWGACLDNTDPTDPSYVIFSGANYGSAIQKDIIAGNAGVTIDTSGAPAFLCSGGGITFAQLSGNSNAATITVSQGAIIATISTNQAGRIDW